MTSFEKIQLYSYIPQTATIVNTSTVIGVTGTFTVGGYKRVLMDIAGSAITPTVTFYGEGVSTTPHTILGTNISTGATGVSAVTSGQLWQFDVGALSVLRVVATPCSPANANVTIYGRAVP